MWFRDPDGTLLEIRVAKEFAEREVGGFKYLTSIGRFRCAEPLKCSLRATASTCPYPYVYERC